MSSAAAEQWLRTVQESAEALERLNQEQYDQLDDETLDAMLAGLQRMVDGFQRQERLAQLALVRRLTAKRDHLREMVEKGGAQ